ncbi:hypothetical protein ACN28S_51055 [Cystobacter fuscus]
MLVSIPLRESSWIVAGITLGTMCGTACGVLWMQRADTRPRPTREQVQAVAWGLAESLVLVASLSLISLQFIQAQLYWGMERSGRWAPCSACCSSPLACWPSSCGGGRRQGSGSGPSCWAWSRSSPFWGPFSSPSWPAPLPPRSRSA